MLSTEGQYANQSRFDQIFAYDELHLPRIWSSELEVDSVYRKAFDAAISALEQFAQAESWSKSVRGISDAADLNWKQLVCLHSPIVSNYS